MSKEKFESMALQEIREFNRERDWEQFHTPENLAKSIVIEAGELLECFQWTNEFKPENVKEELADVYSYVLMMADELGFDLEEILLEKIEKNREKYPADRFKGSSDKYDQVEEYRKIKE